MSLILNCIKYIINNNMLNDFDSKFSCLITFPPFFGYFWLSGVLD